MDQEVKITPNTPASLLLLWLGILATIEPAGGEAREAGASHAPANRLIREKSPYLLQHAYNPVDWFPWGEEAFARARGEDKMIFLSVGYSTCHWCHVMERESFENSNTAALMNQNFVNIKVDREERPDVDRVYMRFVQATTGSGGWPMSVWLTPDLKPILGGTYFPPENRWGKFGFPVILQRVATLWETHREEIESQADGVLEALRRSAQPTPMAGQASESNLPDTAFRQYSANFDSKEGGFNSAPKFPRPVNLSFLLHYYASKEAGDAEGAKALEMALFTLRKMARGGIYDHIGGGFHRYSVDRFWHVPHFEKMLYDQAQLVCAYLDAFQITGDSVYSDLARDNLKYVLRDMKDSRGGFYSAEDADSFRMEDSSEKVEGAFYVWKRKSIHALLDRKTAEVFIRHFGVSEVGNAPPKSDPHDEFVGWNILKRRESIEETAEYSKLPAEEVRNLLTAARAKLFSFREKRPRPHRDDKIITSWNGLMISAFARAAHVLQQPKYLRAAEEAATFISQTLYDSKSKRLLRIYRNGPSKVEGFAEDYAFFIQGLIDLYEASLNIDWLKLAVSLQDSQDALFLDPSGGGYFSDSGTDSSILLRMKESYDGAVPSANSVSVLNLLRIAQMTGSKESRMRAEKTLQGFRGHLREVPLGMPQMLVAHDFLQDTPPQIILAGRAKDRETRLMLKEIFRRYIPNKVVLLADGAAGQQYLSQNLEVLNALKPMQNKTTAYVCENYTCQLPTTDLVVMARLLDKHIKLGNRIPVSVP